MADSIIKETFILTLTYEMSVDTETGEVLETRLVDRSVNKPESKPTKASSKRPKLEDSETEPKLYLEDNKFRLNSAAIKLMELEDEIDVKLDIKYDNSVPILGTDEAFGTKGGNKLTKTNTVAYRGGKNEELAKYGTEFTLIPLESKSGLFKLDSGKEVQPVVVDENISVGEEDVDLPFETDLTEIELDEDANIVEIDSNFFKL